MRADDRTARRRARGVLWDAGLAALLAAGVVAGAAAQTTEQLQREALEQAKAGGQFAWAASRALTWDDFRGRPRAGLFKAAETVSRVTYLIGCLGQETRFTVVTTFSTMESWVRRDVRDNAAAGAQTLRHEQTHFDITELFGRELRRVLGEATGLCPGDLMRARALFDSLSVASQALQARYDLETEHGTNADMQHAWSLTVQGRLEALAAYAEEPAGNRAGL